MGYFFKRLKMLFDHKNVLNFSFFLHKGFITDNCSELRFVIGAFNKFNIIDMNHLVENLTQNIKEKILDTSLEIVRYLIFQNV